MRTQLPLVALLILTILIAVIFYFRTDGFVDLSASDPNIIHSNFVRTQQKNYNPVGISLIAANNQGALGDSADAIMGTTGTNTTFPLNDGKTGLFAKIKKCEAVTTADCSAFDDPSFQTDCGICLDLGKNSEQKTSTGGLVLLPGDRTYAKSVTKKGGIPDYQATVGSCPANRLVSSKAECLLAKRKIECENKGSYDLKDCSQCYSDQSYTIVDSDPKSGIVAGTGTLNVVGKGTLSYTETGFSSKSGITLSSTPYAINLQGPETTRLSITVTSPSGSTGSLGGYLSGNTATGEFIMDLYRLVLTDTTTGRKPRTVKTVTVNGNSVTSMAPGFGQTQMTLVLPMPFTFVDPDTQEATVCKDSPFVTKQASSEFLNSDPCYKKGSGPGKFSLECLQALFLSNGCVAEGKAYPGTAGTASALMGNSNGTFRSLSDIADVIYANAVASSTGVSEDGVKLSVPDWSKASVFCTGKAITSPCDTGSKTSGPLSTDCLTYLWNNGGGRKNAAGVVNPSEATYSIISMASSMFTTQREARFCQAKGTLSPLDENGTPNAEALTYWKSKGGYDAVKAEMKKIHEMANTPGISDGDRLPYLQKCYGLTKLAAPVLAPSLPKMPSASSDQEFEVTRNRIAGYVDITSQDYSMSFDMIIRGISGDWSNIVHVTSGENCCAPGNRTPGIWLWPGETRLHLRLGDSKEGNWGIDTDALPLNKKINVNLSTSGRQVTITLNARRYTGTQPGERPTGQGFIVYMADPWYYNANVKLFNFKYVMGGTPVNILPSGIMTAPVVVPLINLELQKDLSGAGSSGAYRSPIEIRGQCPFVSVKERTGIYFNGSIANYIFFNYSAWQRWTACWWFYSTDAPYYTMASITNPSFTDPRFQSDTYGGGLRHIIAMPNHWTNVPTDKKIDTVGKWNHVAYTYDAFSLKSDMYVNGEYHSSVQGTAPMRMPTDGSPLNFIIGRSGDNGRGFNGLVSEFKFFDRVLNAGQIKKIAEVPAYNKYYCSQFDDHAPDNIQCFIGGMTNDIMKQKCDNDPNCRGYNFFIDAGKNFSGCLKTKTNITNANPTVLNMCAKSQGTGGNNGTVTCEHYCRGPGGGKPWNGELPQSWNGATCAGSLNNPAIGCNAGSQYGITCLCKATGTGWN